MSLATDHMRLLFGTPCIYACSKIICKFSAEIKLYHIPTNHVYVTWRYNFFALFMLHGILIIAASPAKLIITFYLNTVPRFPHFMLYAQVPNSEVLSVYQPYYVNYRNWWFSWHPVWNTWVTVLATEMILLLQ